MFLKMCTGTRTRMCFDLNLDLRAFAERGRRISFPA
eukprot:SAG31_NODE_18119_length_646_cov_1.053016_2_plen_35_part_01